MPLPPWNIQQLTISFFDPPALGELEATNQLLKDEYQTLQLALSSAEQKLITAQKENDLLVAQILDMKERDVMVSSAFCLVKLKVLNDQNDLAYRQNSKLRRL